MLRDLFQRTARRFLLTENIEQEFYWLLVVIRWLLVVLLVLMTSMGISFIVQDFVALWHWFRSTSATSHPYVQQPQMTSATVVKTVLVGLLAFIVPRLVWQWLVSGSIM